jgi:hypothetical protein
VGWSFNTVQEHDVDIVEINSADNYQETAVKTHKVLYLVGGCVALRSDSPFPFAEQDILETLRAANIL